MTNRENLLERTPVPTAELEGPSHIMRPRSDNPLVRLKVNPTRSRVTHQPCFAANSFTFAWCSGRSGIIHAAGPAD